MALNVLWLFFINSRQRIVCSTVGVQQFVKFRLQSLRVALFCSLDQQSHKPHTQGRNGVPVKRIPVEDNQSKA
jgi:hypothetical protein